MPETIYFDNAATAGRRPPEVEEAVLRALREVSANPGRSGHRLSAEAGRVVEDARGELASLLGARDPAHVVFTKNATEAINLALMGYLGEGDLVLASSWEHNAVMRPLRWLESARGVRVELIPAGAGSPVDLEWLEAKLGSEDVRLVTMLAASNVTGEIMPVARVGGLARARGVFFLVDGAQGAGLVDINVERDHIDALAVTGHKALYGPPGTGALYLRDPGAVEPLIRGGTGSRSDEEHQPDFAPDRFEAGTANVPALAGLAAGARYVKEQGREHLAARLRELASRLVEGLRGIPGLRLYGPGDPAGRLGIVSFTIGDTVSSDVARELEEEGVLSRPGLHCAPRAHRTLGTFPGGTVRLSLSAFNTADEVDAAAAAVRGIGGRRTSTTETRRHGERLGDGF